MSIAPHAGIVDFGVFQEGIQGEVPGPPIGNSDYLLTASGWVSPSSLGLSSYETVSLNLKAYPYVLNHTGTLLTSKVWTTPTGTVTKTLNRTGTQLTSLVLSGDIPTGIQTTKTLGYSGTVLISATYS